MLVASLLAAAVVSGCGGGSAGPAGDSTLQNTWVGPGHTGEPRRGPGEPFVDRTALAPRSRPVKQLALFAQFTDAHVRDEESPARVPFLDRYGGAFSSTFRPQEALSPQVLTATVRAIDALHPQAVVENGDLIDNDQSNELDQALRSSMVGRSIRTAALPATAAFRAGPTLTLSITGRTWTRRATPACSR